MITRWNKYFRGHIWSNDDDEYSPYDGDKPYTPDTPDYTPSPTEPSGTIESILERMELFYNTPYVWGGSSLSGADCSFFVNYCYGTTDVGSHGISSSVIRTTYTIYGTVASGTTPKNGMILWKSGHVALYKDGYVYEMASTALDFQKRSWESQKNRFTYILYSTKINY